MLPLCVKCLFVARNYLFWFYFLYLNTATLLLFFLGKSSIFPKNEDRH